MTRFKDCSRNFHQSTNMVLVNGGLLALYGHKGILVNSSLKATKKNQNTECTDRLVNLKYVAMINVKLGLLIQDCRKNVKFCYCVCFSSGYKVQSGLIQIQFNPLTLPDTIDYLLFKKKKKCQEKLQFFFYFQFKTDCFVVMISPA